MMEKLELIVIERKEGSLKTNLDELEKFVLERLEEYTPDKFSGDADVAKAKRAELNNAKKQIGQERIKLVKELMKPFDEFVEKCKSLEKLIDGASSQLDEIVKAKEKAEAELKKAEIEKIWLEQEFDLISLDRFFDNRWLNKGEKLGNIEIAIKATIKKITDDLKIIEELKDGCDDVKAFYLESLDLSQAMQKHKNFAEQKQRAEQEKLEREAREQAMAQARAEQEKIQKESITKTAQENEAVQEKKDIEKISFTLKVTGTIEQLQALRKWIDENQLTYEKL